MGLEELLREAGGLLLSFCALPQLYHILRYKTTEGISVSFLVMWGGGELLVCISLILAGEIFSLFFLNYFLNFLIMCVILLFRGMHIYERKKIQKNK